MSPTLIFVRGWVFISSLSDEASALFVMSESGIFPLSSLYFPFMLYYITKFAVLQPCDFGAADYFIADINAANCPGVTDLCSSKYDARRILSRIQHARAPRGL